MKNKIEMNSKQARRNQFTNSVELGSHAFKSMVKLVPFHLYVFVSSASKVTVCWVGPKKEKNLLSWVGRAAFREVLWCCMGTDNDPNKQSIHPSSYQSLRSAESGAQASAGPRHPVRRRHALIIAGDGWPLFAHRHPAGQATPDSHNRHINI
jgi:hypothetical protein